MSNWFSEPIPPTHLCDDRHAHMLDVIRGLGTATTSDLYDAYSRNVPAKELHQIIADLMRRGAIENRKVNGTGGRPRIEFRLTEAGHDPATGDGRVS